MPDVGRFFNIDVLAEDYDYQTPYAFSENKVTNHIELEGLEAVPIGPLGIPMPPPPPIYGSRTTGMHPVGRMVPEWFTRGVDNIRARNTGMLITAIVAATNIYQRVVKSESDSKGKSTENKDDKKSDEEGIVYKRKDKNGEEKDYVGQAKNDERYKKRQKEHQRANDDADYDFEIIDRGKPGKDLDRKEQKHIDEGGGPTNKSNPNGGLQNKRNQIKPPKTLEKHG